METQRNFTHTHENETLEQIKQRIIDQGDRPEITTDELLKIVDGVNSFPLGRFLLFHKGLNGFWTHYMVTHPERKNQKVSQYETLLLEQVPLCLATQERYRIFKKLLQPMIKEGVKMASIPCGLMGELLTLDYSHVQDFFLYGVDLDKESIKLAEKWAKDLGMHEHCAFKCQDAWEFTGSFDVIVSNGLNFYISDPEKVLELYQTFCAALKPGGALVTSFFTPPPNHPVYSTEWKLSAIPPQCLKYQKIFCNYLVELKFHNFFPESVVVEQLKKAGFDHTETFYDNGHLFPTIRAYKK